jgi:hypothetical protein
VSCLDNVLLLPLMCKKITVRISYVSIISLGELTSMIGMVLGSEGTLYVFICRKKEKQKFWFQGPWGREKTQCSLIFRLEDRNKKAKSIVGILTKMKNRKLEIIIE